MDSETCKGKRLEQWYTDHKQQYNQTEMENKDKKPNFKERNEITQSSNLSFRETGINLTCYTQEVWRILVSLHRKFDGPGRKTELVF